MRKKKILFVTDSIVVNTGFGKAAKLYIEYLYKTNKYEIVQIAMGTTDQNPQDFERFPFKVYPAINIGQLQNIKQNNDPRNHEGIDRMGGYGQFTTEEIITKEHPDIVIFTQDIWAMDFIVDKPIFKNIHFVFWTTLDSLPLLPKAVEVAPKVTNYWIWADFATKEMHKLGHAHVKTVRGPVDIKTFHKLSDPRKIDLRIKNNIPEDCFVQIFLGRNQLRKSYPQMLQGFKLFKNECKNTKFILHCHWGEGWDLPRLIKEYGIDNNDILTTYICKVCRNYEVKPFTGQDLDCKFCQTSKSQLTTSPGLGITDEQLNEIYNLADVSVSAFSSGGQEIHNINSKLAELPTLITNYSCGEDQCVPEAYTLALDWAEYREPGTQFIKATTYPSSICKQLTKVYKMSHQERQDFGKKARRWAVDNFSIEKIGKQLEDFIDNTSFVIREDYLPNNSELDDIKWLQDAYQGFFGKNILENSDEFKKLLTLQ